MKSSSGRVPFADLTNKLSTLAISSNDDIKTREDKQDTSTSKLSAASFTSIDDVKIKPRKDKTGSNSSSSIKLATESLSTENSNSSKIKQGSKGTKQNSEDVNEIIESSEEVTKKEDQMTAVSSEKKQGRTRGRPPKLELSPVLGASSLTEFSAAARSFSVQPEPPLLPGSFYYLGGPSSGGFQLMSPFSFPPPVSGPQYHGSQGQDSVAYVVRPGYISLKMSHGVVLDIGNDMSLRLSNPRHQTWLAVCATSREVAIIHPQARALVYQPRVEVQVQDAVSVKNAKFYPSGISFTADNLALVYLLDTAGARSTSDSFHDLHGTDIVTSLFQERCLTQHSSAAVSCEQLDQAQYWRSAVSLPLFLLPHIYLPFTIQDDVDCWRIGDVFIQQTSDGYVMVDRQEQGGSKTILRASPANGKFKFGNSLIQVKVPVMYLGWCQLSLSLPPGNWQPGRGRPLLREVRLQEASLHRPLQPLHGEEPVPQRRL